MPSMVEGAQVIASRHNPENNPIEIAEHVTSKNSHHVKTFFLKQRITSRIAPWLIAAIMPLSVDLDDQPVAEAGEVGCYPTHRKLRPKLQSVRSPSQRLQEQHFGQAEFTAKDAGTLHLLDRRLEDAWAPSTKLRLVPLPVPGRILRLVRHHHILNTPKLARSGMGALRQAEKARPRTSRVWAGSMMPSSHSRAVACHGLPWAS